MPSALLGAKMPSAFLADANYSPWRGAGGHSFPFVSRNEYLFIPQICVPDPLFTDPRSLFSHSILQKLSHFLLKIIEDAERSSHRCRVSFPARRGTQIP
jgi:hypothetical protein